MAVLELPLCQPSFHQEKANAHSMCPSKKRQQLYQAEPAHLDSLQSGARQVQEPRSQRLETHVCTKHSGEPLRA